MEFKEFTLLECIELIIDYRGKTPKKLGGDWSCLGEYKAISAKNIKNNKIVNQESMKTVDKEIYKKWMKTEVQKGDILLTSEAPLGELLYWDRDEKIVLSQRIFGLRPNSEVVNPKYLFAFMNSVFYQKELDARSSGTTVVGIRQAELLKTKLLIPDMKTQRFIGEILYDINSKININEKIIQKTEKLAQLIFKQWFIDFEFQNENGLPYKSSGGKMVESELGLIPEGWDVHFFKEMYSNFDRKRIPLSKRERESRDNMYPYYGAASLMDYVDDYIFNGTYLLLGEDGSVSTSEGKPVLQYVWGKFWVNNHAHVLQGKNPFTTEYIYLLLWHTNIESIVTGAVQKKISQGNLNSLKMLNPNVTIVKEFSKLVSPLFEIIKVKSDEISSLTKLRDILLPKLLSGEIDILEEESLSTTTHI